MDLRARRSVEICHESAQPPHVLVGLRRPNRGRQTDHDVRRLTVVTGQHLPRLRPVDVVLHLRDPLGFLLQPIHQHPVETLIRGVEAVLVGDDDEHVGLGATGPELRIHHPQTLERRGVLGQERGAAALHHRRQRGHQQRQRGSGEDPAHHHRDREPQPQRQHRAHHGLQPPRTGDPVTPSTWTHGTHPAHGTHLLKY